jgi:hypothetical protein
MMKKYKLIKEYPNSCEVGTIYTDGPDGTLDNWPEYFEQVVPLLSVLEGDIFEGDEYYTVFSKNCNSLPKFTVLGPHKAEPLTGNSLWSDDAHFFKTKEAALKYIDNNKPLLSFQEVKVAYDRSWTKEQMYATLSSWVNSKI